MTNFTLALEAIKIFGIQEKDLTSLSLNPHTDNPTRFNAYIHVEGASAVTLQARDLGWKPLDDHPHVMHATVTLQHLDGVQVESFIFVK